jgi:hypothetical protein
MQRIDLGIAQWQNAKNLRIYFRGVNKVLQELPVSILQDSLPLWKFVTFGVSSLARDDPTLVKQRFLGPQPMVGNLDDIVAAARARRQTKDSASVQAKPSGLKKAASSPTL